jgi:hypothetical protein
MNAVESVFSKVAKDAVTAAKYVESKILPALQKAEVNQATIEAITGLISPQAEAIEKAAYEVLGVVISALEAADAAVANGANGLSVSLDAAVVADVKAVAAAIKSL